MKRNGRSMEKKSLSQSKSFSSFLSNKIKEFKNFSKADIIIICLFWVILAVALFGRAYRFGIVPGDINQDEAFAGYNAFTLAHTGKDSFGKSMPVYLVAWGSGMNALESYLAIPFIWIFGAKSWVIRIPMLIASCFSVVTVYKLFKTFVNRHVGLFAMFFVSVMPWHIMLSRWGLESNLAPAFLIFGMYFMLMTIKSRKYYIGAGLFYGLSLYAYATIWAVVPFIILLELIFVIVVRRKSEKGYKGDEKGFKYEIFGFVILLLLSVPLMLFLLVNKTDMEEIKLGFITIPKLLYFRGDEISLKKIPDNFKNLMNILTKQDDSLPWNFIKDFGIYYKFGFPVFIFGLVTVIVNLFRKFRERGLEFFLLINLLAGVVTGSLITVNINRVNLIFLPIICISAYGICALCNLVALIVLKLVGKDKKVRVSDKKRSNKNNTKENDENKASFKKLLPGFFLILPACIYMVFFIKFEKYYFREYADEISAYWCNGLSEACDFYKELDKDGNKTLITSRNVSYPRLMYYLEEPLEEYLSTVQYTNYPSAFLDVASYGRVNFYPDTNASPALHDGSTVYLADYSFVDTPLYAGLASAGYEYKQFGNFVMWY